MENVRTCGDAPPLNELLENIRKLQLRNEELENKICSLESDEEGEGKDLTEPRTASGNPLGKRWLVIHRVICEDTYHNPAVRNYLPAAWKAILRAGEDDDHIDERTLDDIISPHVFQYQYTEDHRLHEHRVHYLDEPRLYRGDTHCSALRGLHHIKNLERFLERRGDDYSFVVFKSYSCRTYCRIVDEKLRKISGKKPAYGFGLLKDAEPMPAIQEEIEVLSDSLRFDLADLVASNPDEFYDWEISDVLTSPYLEFYHFRHKVRHKAKSLGDEARRDIDLILEYIDNAYGQDYREAEAHFKSGKVPRDHITKLIAPGDILFRPTLDQAYKCIEWPEIDEEWDSISVAAYSWGFDGQFKRETVKLSIRWPNKSSEEVLMTELPVYPLKYAASELRDRLERRGRTWWNSRKKRYVSFDPPGIGDKYTSTENRYMVDYATYRKLHIKSESPTIEIKTYLEENEFEREEPPGDDFILLLASTITAFSMYEKEWRTLKVDHIGELKWNASAFEGVVLRSKAKELIEALIDVHIASAAHSGTDIIEGKGNGLIMLFHGSPGTGKTLTAESVAERAQRPLYRVTCGDIGTEPEKVERYLESVFYIGRIWDCVVLLDEADVFLEARSIYDLSRNALVSVFLRTLEYYDGILILTTNRVGAFDEAFKSRIHLAVHYPSLSQPDRCQIWRNSITNLYPKAEQSQEPAKSIIANLFDYIGKLGERELNGRQIRSICRIAKQLALHKKQQLNYDHLEHVWEITCEFEDYLVATRGFKDDDWAKEQGLRT